MLSDIFIKRPKLAVVIAILIAVSGSICLVRMPVSEYPHITPPLVSVSCSYAGASPKVVSDTVATPIEDQVNAVDNVLFFDSRCNDSGTYNLFVTFKTGTNPDINLVNVQNAIKRAEPKLPSEVTRNGITVRKSPEDCLVSYAFMTDGLEMSVADLCNFVEKAIADSVQRLDGVSEVSCSDRQYAMRVWLDPIKMSGLGVTVADVKSAISAQNIQAAAGTVGSGHASEFLSYKVNVRGRLKTAEEFGEIVVRTNPKTAARVQLRDFARIELGFKNYASESSVNGEPAIFLSAYKAPEANSVSTANLVKEELERWRKKLPKGVRFIVVDDSTAFTRVFLKETVKALFAALLMVVVITYLFLQDWRSTFIPSVAIPISILGTFMWLLPAGYTLNVLTMFGLILVIGSLVDNAIVVVENTQAIMAREGLPPKEAASKSMKEVTAPIIAATLVSLACYVPLAFYQGMVGKMYVQFAVTMSVALVFSTVVAIVLSPVLCAYMLKPSQPRGSSWLFLPFNALFEGSRWLCLKAAGAMVRHRFLSFVLFAALLGGGWYVSRSVPEAFLPKEDRGYINIEGELSEGSSLDRSCELVADVEEALKGIPGIECVSSTAGSSFLGLVGENHTRTTVRLKHWDVRNTPETRYESIFAEIKRRLDAITRAKFTLMRPTPIAGLGGIGGVMVNLCTLDGDDIPGLAADGERYAEEISDWPEIASATCSFRADTPQLFLDIDRDKAEALGVTASSAFSTLQSKLASVYVNDFNLRGGSYQVIVQNDNQFRADENDVNEILLPGKNNTSVPLGSVGTLTHMLGPRVIKRYCKYYATSVVIRPKDKVPSLSVIDKIEANPPPSKYILAWSVLNMQELANRGQIVWLLLLAVFFAYMFLVAQYESWSLPLSVMLSTGIAVVGALVALWITETHLSVYAQLGLVMLIGLAAKNAILTVEFSKRAHDGGAGVEEAAIEGLSRRYRAVQMTAWSFIFGVLPLVFATGAGAGAMRAIGISTFGGMVVATVVGLVFVPVFFALFTRKGRGLSEKRRRAS